MGLKNRNRGNRQRSWIMSFNDMLTVMLAFFVMLLSMSSIDGTKIRGVSSSLNKVFGSLQSDGRRVTVFNPFVTTLKDQDIETAKKQVREGKQHIRRVPFGPSDVRADLVAALNKVPGIKAVTMNKNVSLSLEENLLFQSGSAEIKRVDDPGLRVLCLRLKNTDASIRVEGNTDDVPIKSNHYPSNWELSTARAVNVVKYLIAGGISPERLSAVGYGPSKPVAQNSNEQNRTLNRRVNIVLTFGES